MIRITLKDGSSLEFPKGEAAIALAKNISEGLARVACAAVIDGQVCDLRTPLMQDCEVRFVTFDDEEGRRAYRHTASHVLAQAVLRLYPNAKLAIGPAIDDGFYYDFDVETPFSPEDLPKIEAEMKKIIIENLPIERFTLPRAEGIALMEKLKEG